MQAPAIQSSMQPHHRLHHLHTVHCVMAEDVMGLVLTSAAQAVLNYTCCAGRSWDQRQQTQQTICARTLWSTSRLLTSQPALTGGDSVLFMTICAACAF